jgi:ADP-ribose pyrophosphatase YjhB (NUDIX family)
MFSFMEEWSSVLRSRVTLKGDGAPPSTAARRLMAPFSSEDLGRGVFLNQYTVRVSAAVLRPGDEILVVRQLDRGLERINLPGGMAHFNESLKQALVREVCEETGFEVIPTEIAFVAEGCSERWPYPTLELCFYAQIERQTEPPDRTGEQIVRVEWLSLHDPQLLRFIPHAAYFASSKRGRYVDATGRGRAGVTRERSSRP